MISVRYSSSAVASVKTSVSPRLRGPGHRSRGRDVLPPWPNRPSPAAAMRSFIASARVGDRAAASPTRTALARRDTLTHRCLATALLFAIGQIQ